jgi:hypothetical protein
MRLLSLLLLGFAVCSGEQGSIPPAIRSIQAKLITTSADPVDQIGFQAIAKALKSRGVYLAVEDLFDPAELQRAKGVIEDLYSASGRHVRVDHSVMNMSRGVEITFEVVELCNCK